MYVRLGFVSCCHQYLRRWKAKIASQGVGPSEREAVPALKDATGWHIFCLGFTEDDDEDDEEVVESGGRKRWWYFDWFDTELFAGA